jgi:hypothetical protein
VQKYVYDIFGPAVNLGGFRGEAQHRGALW